MNFNNNFLFKMNRKMMGAIFGILFHLSIMALYLLPLFTENGDFLLLNILYYPVGPVLLLIVNSFIATLLTFLIVGGLWYGFIGYWIAARLATEEASRKEFDLNPTLNNDKTGDYSKNSVLQENTINALKDHAVSGTMGMIIKKRKPLINISPRTGFVLAGIIFHLLIMIGYLPVFRSRSDELLGLLILYFPVSFIILPVSMSIGENWKDFFSIFLILGGLWYGLACFIIGSLLSEFSGGDKSRSKSEFINDKDDNKSGNYSDNTMEDLLKQAEILGRSGEFEKAADLLERALKVNDLATYQLKITGFPRERFSFWQLFPACGYALLVDLSSRAGKKDLSLTYFKRMLEINPQRPDLARKAARSAQITKEAKIIAKEMGIPFHWYDSFTE